jgi:hypothetical protein
LIERETRLKATLADLNSERADLAKHLRANIPTDEEIESIVAACEEISVGLGNATFEDKRKYFDWLQVRGKLAVENDEKVVYAKCRIGEQRLSVVATSPSSSNHNVTPIIVAARLVIGRAQPADFRQALMSINADESP